MSQLKKGAFLNYTTIILTNVIGLLMTPFILNNLGKAEYGIYLTIGALVGTISLLDFGLNNTIVRFVAKYKAEKDIIGQENFLATTLLIYFGISSLVVIIGIIFYGHIDTYFTKMNPEEIEIAKIIFAIFIFNLAVGLPGGSLTGICYGYEKFVFPKTLNIVRYVLRSVTVVAVLLLGGKAIALVIIDSIFNICIILITGYYVFNKLKIKVKLHSFSVNFIKQIFSYSTWIFVFALVSLFQWKAGHWVLGRISPPGVLTIYGIGIVLGTYYGAFSTAISSVFLPRATKMSVDNASGEELTDMMIKIGRLSFIILMFILTAFFLFGKQFVFLWVGGELGKDGSFQSWIIALMIMLAYTLPLVQGFGNSILEAKNKLRFKAILYLSFMILGTILGAVLAYKYEGIGMMAGSVIAWIIVQNVMNFYYHKKIGLNIIRFFKELFNRTIFVIILALGFGFAINLIPGIGWLNFLIKAVIYTIIFCFLTYNIGLIDFEKDLFKKTLSPILKFKKLLK
ncbi:lipopolysaccharide biosynthesis protein [Flavivirga rizhaonensis]|uniref:lipopolysaccharide biosynthesis protein n=1 Tax=Flavivirga rizhaonensis TaxID=2559571 RepID=UPI001476F9DA|nr:oligosaccharide flippase family protein [Flavivirga rizhaonensis]